MGRRRDADTTETYAGDPLPPKGAMLSFRLSADLKRELRRMARTDKRQLGDFVRVILERHVEASHAR
jgi:hypothetical protein